ncbi:MAG TPA: rhamnogalacturonan lyase B N-terminal domain-containing protein [Verrucomicrobiae bacterium]|nr:rhamnogalacturonan lyase B N-terminal domain-containing protein [Verrucomicrobiae bacterium]
MKTLRAGILLIAAVGVLNTHRAEAAFGLTTTTDYYTVDTGAGLVFSVRRTDPSNNTQAAGDISSLKFNGVEYQNQSKGSQIGIGLGAASVSATTYGSSYIKITVNDGNGLTHYYMARNGYPYVYMATYFTSEPSLGNVRYITRIPYSLLPHGPAPSDLNGNTGAIESSDVFGMSDGTTRSKHYSNHRQMDWTYTGATGSGVGVWMVKGNTEGMSGGPFYRSLINQGDGTGGDQEIYELINYGEAQTEANRTGILNIYTLVFTTGGNPPSVDTSWESNLGLTGYVSSSGRGTVAGVGIAGRDTSYQYVVGFANSQAQYWTTARSSDGYFSCGGMLPGTYTMTIYKGELAVWTGSATVTAGNTAIFHTITITGDPSSTATIWRVGNWDGTPLEFKNGNLVTYMHPSDSRVSAWTGNYIVGYPSNDFPCYEWKDINQGIIIYFKLTAAQLATSHTLKIGLTGNYIGGRIQPSVNSWTASIPSAPSEPGTRSLTVGTYRENNVTYTFTVPSSAFQTDPNQWNILKLNVISGSSGSGYLSPGVSYDCVELDN